MVTNQCLSAVYLATRVSSFSWLGDCSLPQIIVYNDHSMSSKFLLYGCWALNSSTLFSLYLQLKVGHEPTSNCRLLTECLALQQSVCNGYRQNSYGQIHQVQIYLAIRVNGLVCQHLILLLPAGLNSIINLKLCEKMLMALLFRFIRFCRKRNHYSECLMLSYMPQDPTVVAQGQGIGPVSNL